MGQLVEAPLQERGVEGDHRAIPLRSEPRREGDRVLLGDADVEKALRELLGEGGEAGAVRHGRGHRHDPVILLGELFQGLPEDSGVGGGSPLPLVHLAGGRVEGAHAVEQRGVRLGRRIPLPLLGQHVDQHRVVEALHVFQGLQQKRDVVAVDGAYVLEAERLEKHPRGEEPLERLLGPLGNLQRALAEHREPLEERLQLLLGLVHELRGDGARQQVRQRADVLRDGHLVVVQDHHQVLVQLAGVVQRLEGDPPRHGAVPDDGDHLVVLAGQVARHTEAERRRDGGGGVPDVEGVVR